MLPSLLSVDLEQESRLDAHDERLDDIEDAIEALRKQHDEMDDKPQPADD